MSADATAASLHRHPAASPLAKPRELWDLLVEAGTAWYKNNAMRLSASMAMYTILSLAPLLVITIKVVSLVLSEEAATGQVNRQLQAFLGPKGAGAVEDMVQAASKPGSGWLATAISIVILLFTASGVFNELRDSLNALWGVTPKSGGGIWGTIRQKL